MDSNGRISTLRIERSDPHKVVAHEMKGKGRGWTALEQLREKRLTHPRSDIFMVLFQRYLDMGSPDEGQKTKSKQLWVYPTKSGEPNFGEAGEWMTEEEKAWCREENARILAVTKEYPEWEVYLRWLNSTT